MKTFEMPAIEVIAFTSEVIMASGIGNDLPNVNNGLNWL